MRTKRVSGNTAYTYYYNGDMLRYLDYDSNTTDSSQAAKLYFVLDASGNPIEVSYRPEGSTTTKFYYYVQNLQGDVIALVDSANGNTVVTYTYDAWGNVLSVGGSLASTLGAQNPFRYRGYVYDTETQLYYLQSRYYDPNLGRFLNADSFASTGQGVLGNNMFAYCLNNPVRSADYYGTYAVHTLSRDISARYAPDSGLSGAGVGVLLIGTLVVETINLICANASDIYALAKMMIDAGASMYADHQPRVHHVIPKGKFYRYGRDYVRMMNDMHDMLRSVDIDINDPENLLLVSHGIHKSMHKKEYIRGIYAIMMQATIGNKDSVRQALFFARIYAASWDTCPNGW